MRPRGGQTNTVNSRFRQAASWRADCPPERLTLCACNSTPKAPKDFHGLQWNGILIICVIGVVWLCGGRFAIVHLLECIVQNVFWGVVTNPDGQHTVLGVPTGLKPPIWQTTPQTRVIYTQFVACFYAEIALPAAD